MFEFEHWTLNWEITKNKKVEHIFPKICFREIVYDINLEKIPLFAKINSLQIQVFD